MLSLVELLSATTAWNRDAGGAMLDFKSCSSCSFLKTEETDVQVGPSQVQETESMLGNWRSTVKTTTKVKHHVWNTSVEWSINLGILDLHGERREENPGNPGDPILDGRAGEELRSKTEHPSEVAPPEPPVPSRCKTRQLDVRWLRRRLSDEVLFAVNRSSPACRTPSVNEETQAALDFFGQLQVFADQSNQYLRKQLPQGEGQRRIYQELQGNLFKPVLSLFAMDNATCQLVLKADLPLVVELYRKSLAERLEEQQRTTLRSADFSEYIHFHGRVLLGGLARVRVVLRSRSHQQLREGVQLSSAATITLHGEHFLHAAIFHRFAREPEQALQLVARARQLSSFVLMVGKIVAADACASAESEGGYEHGRLHLPFVGHTTFGKYPPLSDWTELQRVRERPDFAVLGVPNDMGTQFRSGARMGPRGIREASTLYQFGHKETRVFDADTGETYSYGSVLDVGDVDIVHTDQATSLNRTQEAVEAILSANVTPIILGGDHAITAPVCAALQVLQRPVFLVQIDAHLDFVDQRHGVRFGHGNSMRRCLELQLGRMLVDGGKERKERVDLSIEMHAAAMGSTVLSVRKVRELGVAAVAEPLVHQWGRWVVWERSGLQQSEPEWHKSAEEIQLTQDLIELFVRYQVPPDLMSYEAGSGDKLGRVSPSQKLQEVKQHVKALWDTISASKEKQLKEQQEKQLWESQEEAKMRNMQTCGSEECPMPPPRGVRVMASAMEDSSNYMEMGQVKEAELAATSVQLDSNGPKMAKVRPMYMSRQVPQVHTYASSAPRMMKPEVEVAEDAADAADAESFEANLDTAVSAEKPKEPNQEGHEHETSEASEGHLENGSWDYTKIPHQLDANFLKYDTEAKLRPSKIKVGEVWQKQEQLGALPLESSSLHVLVAATHCFDETIIDTAIKQNQNPIEKLERSMMIVASTIYQKPARLLLQPGEVERMRYLVRLAWMLFFQHGDHGRLEKMAGSLRTLRMVRLARMIRLLRVLRLAKVARHSEVISIVLESLVESATGIFVLMSFVSMWALVCATVVYAAEIDAPDTDFVSIPAALWWSMATISTVGYGDMVPHTSIGKLVGGVSMLGGILITSISVAVITTSFTEHYQQRCRVHEAKREAPVGSGSHVGAAVQEVQKQLVRLEAELLFRPLRNRPTDYHVALELLKDCLICWYLCEWLELKALRCEEELRSVLDFIRSLGSGERATHQAAAPEDVLQLFHALDSDLREAQAEIRMSIVAGIPLTSQHPISGDTPLDFAILRGRTSSVRTLLACGATPFRHTRADPAELFAAAEHYGLEDVVRLCSQWTRTVEAKQQLFASAHQGDALRCAQLLQMKVDPSSREEVTGFSVLEWAVLSPALNTDVVLCLLPYSDSTAKQSALRMSAIYGVGLGVLEGLLGANCDPSLCDADGWTPLDWAISQGANNATNAWLDFALDLLQYGGPQLAYACRRPLASLARVARSHPHRLHRLAQTELLELLLRGTLQLNAPLQVCAYAGHWPLECSLCLDRFDLALQLLRWHADVHTAGASLPAVLQRVASRATPETGDLLRLLAASSAPPPSRPPRPPRPPPRPPIAVG
eukprot:g16237.t1